ncbi:MAG: preprotein translocase subunit SecG [Flavobacteriales bacterium]
MVAISIIIIILAVLLALVVLAQNPKGGGLATGFTGASQIGGVQRTADFMEKATWTLASLLMVLCLVSASLQHTTVAGDNLDAPITVDEKPNANAVAAPAVSDSAHATSPAQGDGQ